MPLWWKSSAPPSGSESAMTWSQLVTQAIAVATLLGGVVSFTYNAIRDRNLKITERADMVRASAAQLLGKMNALRNVAPITVAEASEKIVQSKLKLLDDYTPSLEMHAMWGTMIKLEADAKAKVFDLQTDNQYLKFYTFNPDTKRCVDYAIRVVFDVMKDGYIGERKSVEDFRFKHPSEDDYDPTDLWEALTPALYAMLNDQRIDQALTPIENHLKATISREDSELMPASLLTVKADCKG